MTFELIRKKDNADPLDYEQVPAGAEGDNMTQGPGGLTAWKAPVNTGTFSSRAESGTVPPPSTGKTRWNDATQNQATSLYISNTTDESVDLTALLDSITPGDGLYIQAQANGNQYQFWGITAINDDTGFKEYEVFLISSAGGNFSTVGQGEKLLIAVRTDAGNVAATYNAVGQVQAVGNGVLTEIYTFADPTSGDQVLALPDISTVTIGSRRFVKRTENGGNIVTITGNINGDTTPMIFGFKNEYAEFLSDGVTWQVIAQRTFAFGSVASDTVTFAIDDTQFTKFTGFTIATGVSTKNKLVGDTVNSSVNLLNFTEPVDGLKVTVVQNFNYDNNRSVTGQLYFRPASAPGSPVPIGDPISENGLGPSKPATLQVHELISVMENGNFELWLMAETGGSASFEPLSGTLIVERVGG